MASAWLVAFKSHDEVGTLIINTIGVKMDPVAGDGLNPTDLAAEVDAWVGAEYWACVGGQVHGDAITVTGPFPGGTEEGTKAVTRTGGVSTANDLPRELVAICSWKTDVATRSGRGHIALPLPRAAALLSGSALASATGFQTAVAAFFAKLDAGHDWTSGGITEGHLSQVVLSRKHGSYADVKARLLRSQVRWLERRQSAP